VELPEQLELKQKLSRSKKKVKNILEADEPAETDEKVKKTDIIDEEKKKKLIKKKPKQETSPLMPSLIQPDSKFPNPKFLLKSIHE